MLPTGKALSIELGPGLLESIFDGIQRPLDVISKLAGNCFIPKDIHTPALSRTKKYLFTPNEGLRMGDHVASGDIFGNVEENSLMTHRMMVPPNTMGTVSWVAPKGEYHVDEEVLELELKGKKERLRMMQRWPIRKPRPSAERLPCVRPLFTGQRVLDALFPLAEGSSCALPGACGKSAICHTIAKYSESDVVVYVGCGERGNEMAELLMEFPEIALVKNGRRECAMKRTVLVANTSDMALAGREASIYSGITISEYFRDQGLNVCMVADSTSRWAEALRDISAHLGEISDRGYPSSLSARLASLYERAGRVSCLGSPSRTGTCTLVGVLSPPGGDFSDPVTLSTLSIVPTFWALDRRLAQRRHFPSVNWLLSYSEVKQITPFYEEYHPEFLDFRSECLHILQREEELEETVKLVGKESLPDVDKVTLQVAQIIRDDFLQQNIFSEYDRHCPFYKMAGMMRVLLFYHKMAQKAVSADKMVTWSVVKKHTSDLLYRLSATKFESPSQGRDNILAKFASLERDIDDQFSSLPFD